MRSSTAGCKRVVDGGLVRSVLSRHILPRWRSVRYSTTRHYPAHRPLGIGSYPAGATMRGQLTGKSKVPIRRVRQ